MTIDATPGAGATEVPIARIDLQRRPAGGTESEWITVPSRFSDDAAAATWLKENGETEGRFGGVLYEYQALKVTGTETREVIHV